MIPQRSIELKLFGGCKSEYDPVKENIADSSILLHCSIGRLPYMQAVPDKLELGGRVLEHYEVYINYGVVNWCKDSNNNGFAEPDTRQIFAYHYNVSSETEFDLSAKLAKPKLKFTQKVARVVNQYIPVFKLAAERMVEKFEVEVLALPRRTGTQA